MNEWMKEWTKDEPQILHFLGPKLPPFCFFSIGKIRHVFKNRKMREWMNDFLHIPGMLVEV